MTSFHQGNTTDAILPRLLKNELGNLLKEISRKCRPPKAPRKSQNHRKGKKPCWKEISWKCCPKKSSRSLQNQHTHTKPCWKEASWNLTEENVLEPCWRKRAETLAEGKKKCTNKIQTRKSLGKLQSENLHTQRKILPQKTRQERNARKAIARKSPRNSWRWKRALSRQCKNKTVQNLKLCRSPPPGLDGKSNFSSWFFFPFIKPPSYIFPFTPK